MKLKTKLVVATALLGLAATSAQATTYVDIAGVADPVYTFDWNPGNALAVGAIPLTSGADFTLYYQSRLANFNNSEGDPITTNGGLNANYEITLVGGFGETPTVSAGGIDASFALDQTNTTNFFRMYYDTANDSNALSGTGFTNGSLILSGHVTYATGSFRVDTLDPNGIVQPLDGFGIDNWAGTSTVSGTGSTKATVAVDSYDSSYFITTPNQFLIQFLYNTSNILPFNQVNPSQLFTDVNGTTFAPNVGTINGITGPDMLFQADANSSPVVTPEPSTMVLLGAGLFSLSVFARRRKEK